jgi:hypothetical protein
MVRYDWSRQEACSPQLEAVSIPKGPNEEIAQWSKPKPSLWAGVTGAVSGIVTLDFDGAAGRRTMEKLGIRPHRATPSGGFHADFEHPGWPVATLNSKSNLALGARWPGFDIRLWMLPNYHR